MKARDVALMAASVVLASLILRAFPTLKAFVASNSITVRDGQGNTLFDAI